VQLLEEEMRRIIQHLNWQADWWRTRVGLRQDIGDKQLEGDHAYALRQAALKEALAASFAAKWEPLTALMAKARAGDELGEWATAVDLDVNEDVGSEGEEAWPVPANSKCTVKVDLLNQ
jgi:hypothetical protein